MKVESILKSKGARVVTIAPNAKIAELVRVLNAEGIGAVVASGDGIAIEGIISERDVVRGLADHGAELLEMTVAVMMTRGAITCAPEDSLDSLMSQMSRRRIRHLPVIADGALAGIVSIGDVVKNRLERLESEADAMREYISGA